LLVLAKEASATALKSNRASGLSAAADDEDDDDEAEEALEW
jgi:hypothetical protein